MIRGVDPGFHRLMFLLALISAFCSYQGLALVDEANGADFLDKAETTVAAAGMGIAIYLFWTSLYAIMPTLKTHWARAAVLTVALVIGFPVIIGSSSLPHAAGIDGKAAMHTEIDHRINGYEQATAAYGEAALKLTTFETDLTALINKLEADRKAEFETGAISGVPKEGAVYFVLTGAVGKLTDLRSSIGKQQVDGKALLDEAQKHLLALRAVPNDLAPGERAKQVRAIADQLRAVLLRMDARPLAASVQRVLTGLPADIGGLSQKLSENGKVAQRQQEALARLRANVEAGTAKLAELASELTKAELAPVAEFTPISPMRAVAQHWRDYITAWAVGILIDIAGLFPLLFMMVGLSERTRREVGDDALGGMTLRELVQAKTAMDLLRTQPINGAARAQLINAQLGHDADGQP